MRFHYGAIPEDITFQPEKEGWHPIHQPNFKVKKVIVWFVAILTAILLMKCFSSLTESAHLAAQGLITVSISNLWQLLLIGIFIFPVHELLHAFCHPNMGLSDRTLIGFDPNTFSVYTLYEGCLTRNRLLFATITPFVALSILPMVILMFTQPTSLKTEIISLSALLAVLNGMGSSADIIAFVLFFYQIPNHAITKSHHWKTYWKLEVEQ